MLFLFEVSLDSKFERIFSTKKKKKKKTSRKFFKVYCVGWTNVTYS